MKYFNPWKALISCALQEWHKPEPLSFCNTRLFKKELRRRWSGPYFTNHQLVKWPKRYSSWLRLVGWVRFRVTNVKQSQQDLVQFWQDRFCWWQRYYIGDLDAWEVVWAAPSRQRRSKSDFDKIRLWTLSQGWTFNFKDNSQAIIWKGLKIDQNLILVL